MRFKLDEHIDPRLVPLVAEGGHDVDTIRDERLSGSPDDAVYLGCLDARRTLVTLDMDFSNPFRFPPEPTEGIVVVRPPRPIIPVIRATLVSALHLLKARNLAGRLWIVEPGRIRLYDPRGEEGPA